MSSVDGAREGGRAAVMVVQAYRFALDPSPAQARDLARHCGAARFAFNWGLALVKAVMDQRAAEATYGIPAGQLTPALPWSLPALRRAWNQAKGEAAPWWPECSKEAYSSGLANLAAALKNWSESRQGKRGGKRAGFPRFKPRHRAAPACRFTTGAIRLEPDRHHLTLPRVGTLRTCESTRKLARRLEQGTARILSATVRLEAGRWFCSFTCQAQRHDRAPASPQLVIGVDLGVSHLAVLSQPLPGISDKDGFVANPEHLTRAQRQIRHASRRVSRRHGPDRRTGAKPSRRWEKASRQRSKAHHRVARLRRDGLHKLTAALAGAAGTIVVEDLNVAGMLRNRRLARAIADAGFGEIRRQITYKTSWRGSRLIVASRWYPSSKTCSDCGTVKPKLPLRVRGVPLRHLRPGHRPGRQLRTQPRRPRGGNRYRSGRRPGRASAEGTRSRP